ncbi:uncharacterized protein CLUP02_18383 [Colletotrichum lupini]|uniref:Uncharacterized protein n=1 Tax=Colletotrichum lupini TaxID=145971 RepID=A0A9Q8WAQ5_9PEZI|nr:uncharacterized protein CLUP02_18383 [Colletotrichum lupini]UQC76868.1 hypothetical protein CLUP02_18383 [Colletotrichum lupini]
MLNKSERTIAAGWLLSAQTAHEQAEVNARQDLTTSEANPPSETSTTADKSSSRQDIILGPESCFRWGGEGRRYATASKAQDLLQNLHRSEISLIVTLEATISIAISDESIPDAAIELGVDGVQIIGVEFE